MRDRQDFSWKYLVFKAVTHYLFLFSPVKNSTNTNYNVTAGIEVNCFKMLLCNYSISCLYIHTRYLYNRTMYNVCMTLYLHSVCMHVSVYVGISTYLRQTLSCMAHIATHRSWSDKRWQSLHVCMLVTACCAPYWLSIHECTYTPVCLTTRY